MAEDGALVESLPDRPLRENEKEALESHSNFQMIMAQNPTFDSEHGRLIETAMFVGYDWATVVTYETGHGWRVIFRSEMEDNILADGYLRSEDLYDEHPIQQGMDAMHAVASEDDE